MTTLATPGLVDPSAGVFDGANLNLITAAATAVIGKRNVISGTAADFVINMPASPTVGSSVQFVVKDWSVANKQYTLDAGVGVVIAGRTRFLALLHTNVVELQWDGSSWIPIILCLDTPEIDGGAITFRGTTTNPTKGTTTRDNVYWCRKGDFKKLRYTFFMSSAGTAGVGSYSAGIDVGPGTYLASRWPASDAAGYSMLISRNGTAGTITMPGVDSSGNLIARISNSSVENPWGTTGSYSFASANTFFAAEVFVPMTNW